MTPKLVNFVKKKRNSLSLRDKVKILRNLEDKGMTKTDIANKYNIHRTTVRKIEKNANSILRAASNRSCRRKNNFKYVSSGTYKYLENSLFLWFLNQRRVNKTVSTAMIILKAKSFAARCGVPESFKFSLHWAHNFKIRYGIRKLKICGEVLSSDSKSIGGFLERFHEEIQNRELTAQMIYNADESGLFYKMLPSESLVGPNEKNAPGRKIIKLRVTFMPCCNVMGDHKLQMVIIGNSRNPRAFKNIKVPVAYFASKNAWMTRDLFQSWFHQHFVPSVRKFSAEQGIPPKAILLLDNCSAHHLNDELKSDDGLITVYFLPPNVTAMIQPMDQNVIQNCKMRYREKLLLHVMARGKNDIDQCLKGISMKDVCFWMHEAWGELHNTVIQQSWKKIGVILDNKLVHDDDVPLSRLFNINKSEDIIIGYNAEERYACKVITDEDILTIVLDDQSAMDEELEQSDLNVSETAQHPESTVSNSHELCESPEVINNIDAVRMLDKIVEWADASDLSIEDAIFLRRIREIAMKKSIQS